MSNQQQEQHKTQMFDDEQMNALTDALLNISGAKDFNDNETIYNYLEDTPKASLMVELVQSLNSIGYKIVKA